MTTPPVGIDLNAAPSENTDSTDRENSSETIDIKNLKRYTPISYDTDMYTALSEKYGSSITPDLYENQCITNNGKSYFRACSQGKNFDTEKDFISNALCEGFILPIPAGEQYE